MLKITTDTAAGTTTMTLEGRLAGEWIKELDRCWQRVIRTRPKRVLVDLTGVTFIAPEGTALLTQMWMQDAQLRASGCLNTSIVQEIARTNRADVSRRKGNR